MAAAVCGVEGIAQARIHGRADAVAAQPAVARGEPRRGRSPAGAEAHPPAALPQQAAALRRRLPELLRPRPAQDVLGRAGIREPHDGGALHHAHPPPRSPRRLELDRHLPVHDRPGDRGHDRPLPGAEAAPRRQRGPGTSGFHGAAHRAGDELSAQRRASVVPVKKVRILALVHDHLVPPEDTTGIDILEAEWKMEYDVIETLRELGHTVHVLGIHDDLSGIRPTAEDFKPHIVFNLMEAFAGVTTFDQNVVSYLELLRLPYTGCNPRGLILARDKALSKKLLAYHRVRVPEFTVVRPGRKPVLPKRLTFPMIVKSLFYEASAGISQASVVENHEQLARRVSFIHEKLGTAAIVEQFVDGRELYVGVLGNERLDVFPIWEMSFDKMPDNRWKIATERVKWSTQYQKRHGIMTDRARVVPVLADQMQRIAKRSYRALDLNGYARIDFRMDEEGRMYVLEANPNPNMAYGEDFAESAEVAGLPYERLLERIITLGLRWEPARTG